VRRHGEAAVHEVEGAAEVFRPAVRAGAGQLEQEDVLASGGERAATEVDAALEGSGHDDVVGVIDGDAERLVGARATEALAPELGAGAAGQADDEDVLLAAGLYAL